MIMNSGHCFVTVCLLVSSVLAQSEQSKLEASIPPARLQELVASREQAQEELGRSGQDALSPEILRAFREPGGSIAIAKMEQVVTTDRTKFTLTLAVEKALRGTPPQQVPVECYWSDRPWPLRPPQGAQRIKPQTGKRILASFAAQSGPASFRGILDLDDPAESAFLPRAVALAKMDADAATSGPSVYENGLVSEAAVVRDLALQRLLHTKDCPADSHCEESILAEVRRLLPSKNPNDRMEAVQWLGDVSRTVQACQLRPCAALQFHPEPIRELLQRAVQDKNVAVGDLAFRYLATLDFHKKENVGYCEEIVPALRIDRYLFGREHWIGGPLNGASTCVGPAHH
jgi:hypothetical protein